METNIVWQLLTGKLALFNWTNCFCDFCVQAVEDVADYRRKLESVMEATMVPTLRLGLPILIFSRKPSDQWSVG